MISVITDPHVWVPLVIKLCCAAVSRGPLLPLTTLVTWWVMILQLQCFESCLTRYYLTNSKHSIAFGTIFEPTVALFFTIALVVVEAARIEQTHEFVHGLGLVCWLGYQGLNWSTLRALHLRKRPTVDAGTAPASPVMYATNRFPSSFTRNGAVVYRHVPHGSPVARDVNSRPLAMSVTDHVPTPHRRREGTHSGATMSTVSPPELE